MQKLDFNKDGKLVAYTDNGCTDGKSATTEIIGTFEVSADVVKFILAKEYGLPSSIVAKILKTNIYGFVYSEDLHFSLDNDSMNRKIDSMNRKINELEMRIKEVDKENLDLKDTIDDFNRTRRFYERKIKI